MFVCYWCPTVLVSMVTCADVAGYGSGGRIPTEWHQSGAGPQVEGQCREDIRSETRGYVLYVLATGQREVQFGECILQWGALPIRQSTRRSRHGR